MKNVNGEARIQALVNKKKIIVTEASIRRDLRFEDEGGVDYLSNEVIFKQLTLMGSTKTFTIMCLVTNKKYNFLKYIFDNIVKHLDGGVKFLMYPRFVQVFLDNQVEGMDRHNAIFVISSHTKKVFANIKREGKDFSGKFTPLFDTMIVQAPEDIARRVESLTEASLGDQEDASKQGMMIDNIDQDVEITLVDNTHGRMNEEDMFRVNDLDGDEVVVDVLASEKVEQSVKVIEKKVSTADLVTTVGEVVTTAAKPKAITTTAIIVTAAVTRPKEKGIVMQEPSKTPLPEPIISSQKLSQAKRKGKGKMVEPKRPLKRKDHIMMDEEVARNLEAQMQAELEKEERLAR
nr:hypothetical protein [Tanacetum cinerariifolium]